MKFCRLCGLNYEDQVLFCPKCQRNLEYLPPEEEDDGAFTPSGDYDTGVSSQGNRKRYSEPAPDYEACMRQAVEEAQEISASENLVQETFPEEQSEINHVGVIPTLNKERKACARCGTMNPHNQTFCTYCGARVDEGALPTTEEYTPQYYSQPAPSYEVHPVDVPMPSSAPAPGDCSSGYTAPQRPSVRIRQKSMPLSSLAEWSPWRWVGLIGAVIVLSVLIWFFFYGGMDLFFNSGVKNLKNAGKSMAELSSYEYTIDMTFDSTDAGQFKGDGKLLYESPDKTSWAINIQSPAGAILQPRGIQTKTSQFLDTGGGMKQVLLNTEPIDAGKLWSDYSNFENLDDQDLNGRMCSHCKYNISPRIFTTAVGMADSQGIGDAVMEIWIDAETKRVMQIKATVYDLNVGGVKADTSITMVLSATDLQYNIQAPAQ